MKKKDGEKTGRELPIEKTETIKRKSKKIQQINDYIQAADIRLELSEEEKTELKEILRIKGKEPIDFTRNRYSRIYNDASYKKGGRFYGHWILKVPKKFRSQVVINGEPATEYDYSACFIRLAYIRLKLTPPEDDLYAIPGLPIECRGLVKSLMLSILNSKSWQEALGGVSGEIEKKAAEKLRVSFKDIYRWNKPLLKLIEEKHTPIAKLFYTGIGLKFMRTESDIAEAIVLSMKEQGYPVLPIHDSFLAQRSAGEVLRETMRVEYLKKLGVEPKIDRKF